MYKKYCKRLIDIVFSGVGLVLLSWLYLLITLAVFFDDPGPVFFTQNRVGERKKLFNLHKFRTMKISAPHDIPTHLLENPEQYITRVGKFLRKTSLDELPQIWDIFIGKMSIIGPRPLAVQYLPYYNTEEQRRHDVLPGLTGLAQVHGRNATTWEERFTYIANPEQFIFYQPVHVEQLISFAAKSHVGVAITEPGNV